MPSDPYVVLAELADVLPADQWMLVGGLMVDVRARLAGLTHPRPTIDVDIVVELATVSYPDHARALTSIGFTEVESIDAAAPFHQFRRGEDRVDLMVPDTNRPVRLAGRTVPGSKSALTRTERFTLPTGQTIPIPDLASALSLKGAALSGSTSANHARHTQDGVTLFACAGPDPLDPPPSKSMRTNINTLIRWLAKEEPWAHQPTINRTRARQAIHRYNPAAELPATTTTTATRYTPSRRGAKP